jgi:hypothetical protein
MNQALDAVTDTQIDMIRTGTEAGARLRARLQDTLRRIA